MTESVSKGKVTLQNQKHEVTDRGVGGHTLLLHVMTSLLTLQNKLTQIKSKSDWTISPGPPSLSSVLSRDERSFLCCRKCAVTSDLTQWDDTLGLQRSGCAATTYGNCFTFNRQTLEYFIL